jgi:hypothetical protein
MVGEVMGVEDTYTKERTLRKILEKIKNNKRD